MTKLFSICAKAQKKEEKAVSTVVENEIREEEVVEVKDTPKEEKKEKKSIFKKRK